MTQFLNFMIVLIYIMVIPLYLLILLKMRGRSRARKSEQRFYQGVLSIIDNSKEVTDYTGQIGMLYRRLGETQPYLTKNFRSPIELLEELVVKIDTLSESEFKDFYRSEKPTPYRGKIIECLVELKRANPFSLISSKEANLLQTALGSLQSGNKELGERSIMQLAEELEVMESKLRTESKKNNTSFIVTVISAVLTVFFGLISVVPLIQSPSTVPTSSNSFQENAAQ